jgi:hypothetical protein
MGAAANFHAATLRKAGGQQSASWMLNTRKRKRTNIASWLSFDEFCVNYLPQGLFLSATGGTIRPTRNRANASNFSSAAGPGNLLGRMRS